MDISDNVCIAYKWDTGTTRLPTPCYIWIAAAHINDPLRTQKWIFFCFALQTFAFFKPCYQLKLLKLVFRSTRHIEIPVITRVIWNPTNTRHISKTWLESEVDPIIYRVNGHFF